jgi:hypothetical protein
MKRRNLFVFVLIGFWVLMAGAKPISGFGAEDLQTGRSPVVIRGRHSIMVHAGFLNRASVQSTVSMGIVETDVRTNGFAGMLSWSYGVAPEWILGFSVGVLDAKVLNSVEFGTVKSTSAAVIPFLVEMAFCPSLFGPTSPVRPFISLGAGPYTGVASNENVGLTVQVETVTQTVIGMRGRVGLEMFLGRFVQIETAFGYHIVGEFEEPIGNTRNLSGAEFTMGFGFRFGKGW